MADRWEIYRQKVTEAFAKLADTTQRFTKIGKIRMDILSLKKEIEHQQVLLGQRVYQLVKEEQADQIATDEVIHDHVVRIDELKEQIAAKEAEIEELRKGKEKPEPQGETTGVVEAAEEIPQPDAGAAESSSTSEPKTVASKKPENRRKNTGADQTDANMPDEKQES